MSLKSIPIFLLITITIISLISNGYAYTDAQITNMYRGQDENKTLDNIDAALHSGSLHCSDLPSNLVMGYCQNQTTSSSPQPQQTSTPQSNSNSGFMLIPILMIVPVVIILMLKLSFGGDIGIPKVFMKPKTKQVKSDVKQYATFIKEDDSNVDMNTLDDHFDINHKPDDYMKIQQRRVRNIPRPIPTRHKFLLSLGLMKVKKK